ncbi:GNAT family N-acetyltransferase [Nonomuraea sp. MG754425]|uniref:GNAT family N-acetyltransferase n=1 Tax=Nonomuraea sp. MG754425 TaxID=2570319 RepID=UPI001F1E5932|nr:GNAT family protein [Nonomuraea sp. MG754425]
MPLMDVRLREWRADDAPAVLRAFQVPDLRGQAPWPVVTLKDASGWIASWAGAGHAFAVTVQGDVPGVDEERVVGNVAVARLDGHGTGSVSYWVVPEARGRGVAVAATRLLARWAFDERGLFRLELGHRTNNPASCRVATKAGFLPEGIERGKLCSEGVRYDVERHARLATD